MSRDPPRKIRSMPRFTGAADPLPNPAADRHPRRHKSQRPRGSLHGASGVLCTRQDSNLQPSDP
ncbi:hypothetical protein F8144_40860 [Streptomyces triticiradicis]|uniref:Uncharacterized protein n=1 Tax=Streptomyces triticiradicis TaxID=2651189 RepID=A0A7J5D4V7_9ACTN|nr:hypothetical protein F8144_40860 [Streptomyces triticiradicis]